MKIVKIPIDSNTPARVNRNTGLIQLNSNNWDSYSDYEKKIILLHEIGHFLLQTKDEIKADKYAIDNYVGKEFQSLKKGLRSFYETLNMKNREHRKRYNEVCFNIIRTDVIKFGNKNQKLLKIMYDKKIKELLVEFLKAKGILNMESLSNDERELLLAEFYDLQSTQNLIDEMSETDQYSGYNEDDEALAQAIDEGFEEDFSNFALAGLKLIGKAIKTSVKVGGAIKNKVQNKIGGRLIGSGMLKQAVKTKLSGGKIIGSGIFKPKTSVAANVVATKAASGLGLFGKIKQMSSVPKQPISTIASTQTQASSGRIQTQASSGRTQTQESSGSIQTQASSGRTQAESENSGIENTIENSSNDVVTQSVTDAEKTAKKKKIFLFGGIGLGVIVIGVVLYFVLRR